MSKKVEKPMRNVKMTIKGDKLIISVDLGAIKRGELEPSASGRSYTVATTSGNKKLRKEGFENIRVGMNVYIPANEYTPPQPHQQETKQNQEEGGMSLSKEEFELFQQFKAFMAMQKK